jgi:hypothetical protein
MYGKPLPRSSVPSSGTAVRPICNYSQKGCGTFKARNCMNGKQLVCMGHTFEHTYAACMEQHCFRLFIAFAAQLGFLIDDGDVVNAYAHADAEGPTIYLSVDDLFQAWYLERYRLELTLGSCVPLLNAMQGHPEAGNWWSKHFDATCAAPLHINPAFTESTMYRRDDEHCTGPTMMIRQVDDILCGAEHAPYRDSVLDGISTKVTFKRSAKLTSLFFATDIEQCAQYIRVYARSYIESCLAKLGWEATSPPTRMMAPLNPTVLKTLKAAPGPLDPAGIAAMVEKYGFQYRTLTGMLIFAVQIGRFDIGPAVCILSKFKERPNDVHFQAAKLDLKYLRATIDRGLVYWRPTGRERPDLPRGSIIPIRPERGIAAHFQDGFPSLEPIVFVDASYAGLLCIGEHQSISGIIICLGGTAIFAKTGIQKTTALSLTEAEVIAGCAAGKIVKYFRKVFTDLRFPLTRPTPVGEDNASTILISNHNRPSGRTRHLDIQYFASQ